MLSLYVGCPPIIILLSRTSIASSLHHGTVVPPLSLSPSLSPSPSLSLCLSLPLSLPLPLSPSVSLPHHYISLIDCTVFTLMYSCT